MGSSTSSKSTLGSSVIYNYILKWASLSLRRGESDKKDFFGGSLIDKEVIMKRGHICPELLLGQFFDPKHSENGFGEHSNCRIRWHLGNSQN